MAKKTANTSNNEEAVMGITNALHAIANAVTPGNAMAGTDAAGGHIESLTEAVMGITNALIEVARALDGIAAAIQDR